MPDNIALCRQGDRKSGQGDTDQYRKSQKLLRPIQGGTQFRPGIPDAPDIVFFVFAD